MSTSAQTQKIGVSQMHFALGSPFALYKLFTEVSVKQTDGKKHE
jgi:hypothetical protein